MNAVFDMQTEVANLAERIVGPVAAKLAPKALDTAVGQIRNAFERLSTKSPLAPVDFENTAAKILEPVRLKLSEADFARIVDRLDGAMAGFCQRDEGKAQPDAEQWGLQQAGQYVQSEPEGEPWWRTSEQAMALLILLWLCTGIDCTWTDRSLSRSCRRGANNVRGLSNAEAPPRRAPSDQTTKPSIA